VLSVETTTFRNAGHDERHSSALAATAGIGWAVVALPLEAARVMLTRCASASGGSEPRRMVASEGLPGGFELAMVPGGLGPTWRRIACAKSMRLIVVEARPDLKREKIGRRSGHNSKRRIGATRATATTHGCCVERPQACLRVTAEMGRAQNSTKEGEEDRGLAATTRKIGLTT
jgi:hypothetical protein